MKMNEKSLELEQADPPAEDYPPEYLEDYQRWLCLLETIASPEFDHEQH